MPMSPYACGDEPSGEPLLLVTASQNNFAYYREPGCPWDEQTVIPSTETAVEPPGPPGHPALPPHPGAAPAVPYIPPAAGLGFSALMYAW